MEPQQRITWLELLVGFELDTGTRLPTLHSLKEQPLQALETRPPLGRVVTNFRRATLLVIKAHFTRDVAGLFIRSGENSQKGATRLGCMGITGAWSRTYTHPQWGQQLQERVCQALLAQRGVAPRLDSGLAQGPQYVRPRGLDKMAQPGWRGTERDEDPHGEIVSPQRGGA